MAFPLLGVVIAAILLFVLGAVWFTPLFGRVWDRAIGTPGVLVGSAVGGAVGAAAAAACVTTALNPAVSRPLLLGAVTAGYHLVGATAAGALIGLLG